MKRREFIIKTSVTIGAGAAAAPIPAKASTRKRIAWVAALTLERIDSNTPEKMIHSVISRMKETLNGKPDLICLPETFIYNHVPNKPSPKEQAAKAPEHLKPFQEFASDNNCYVVCPLLTEEDGRVHNSAVFIDRNGERLGAYHKMHPTTGEIEGGIMPGPKTPTVFQTDIGTIGAQICFDINWQDGWQKLWKAGADIVVWPSAFPGGRMLNAMAWLTKAYVITATRPFPPRIIDMDGDEIDSGGRFEQFALAPINLEKAFIHIWPYT
ncbi:carbon-nitrogen hydrolase family protein, partial [bacterium]|nr:carbon-nitrogen hydrolase family protein [bacterium]